MATQFCVGVSQQADFYVDIILEVTPKICSQARPSFKLFD